ncbi:acetolactate synthase [Thermoplasmatales archaeon SW_10_69_26]|jgi:hypothetical protein|nr:MAG: acetolactate synthase [Thermoplasmatales archaeon SW_10_69_26]
MGRQLTVFIENEPGALSEITAVLADEDVNIESIMVEGEHDFGFARIRAHPLHEAEEALEEAGFQIRTGEVLTLGLPNQPGALHGMLERLAKEGINIENMYGTANGSNKEPEIVIQVDDADQAREVLGIA